MMSSLRPSFAAALSLLFAACGGGEPLEPAVARAVDDAVVPAIDAFADEAAAVASSAADFCASPTADGLSDLQDEWLRLAVVWNAASPYFAGPLDDDPIVPSMYFVESQRQRGMLFSSPCAPSSMPRWPGATPSTRPSSTA